MKHYKISKDRKSLLVFGFLTVLLMSCILLVFYINNRKQAQTVPSGLSCQDVSKTAEKKMSDLKYDDAYAILTSYKSKCLNTEDRIAAFKYNARLAISGASSGNQKKAKLYAKDAISISNSLNDAQKNVITNFDGIVSNMADIKNGQILGGGGIGA